VSYRDWLVATVISTTRQTPTARSIVLDVPGFGGSVAGQHVDIRLTAPDGYQAARAYSLASAGPGDRIEIAVDLIETGEVSPYLVTELEPGDQFEVRGPLGRWFIWSPEREADAARPVQLVAGGSGVVPLMAMIRAHGTAASAAPLRLLYSVRGPDDVFFGDDLRAASESGVLALTLVYTRQTPPGWPRAAGRISAELVAEIATPAAESPAIFVCGPNGFVSSASDHLIAVGHDPRMIKTERFGGA
jgi:ferredoxin-NADP reductase